MASTTVETPWPTPTQSVASPRRPFRRFSSCTRVVTSRAPEQPRGWPSAMAPPLTLTLASAVSADRSPAAKDAKHLTGEGLVELDEVHVRELEAEPIEQLPGGRDRPQPHHVGVNARRRASADAGQRRGGELLGDIGVAQHESCGPVRQRGCRPCGYRAPLLEHRP